MKAIILAYMTRSRAIVKFHNHNNDDDEKVKLSLLTGWTRSGQLGCARCAEYEASFPRVRDQAERRDDIVYRNKQ